MTEYKHTAADALALAERCAERAARGTGIAINAASADLVDKALRFWAANAAERAKWFRFYGEMKAEAVHQIDEEK